MLPQHDLLLERNKIYAIVEGHGEVGQEKGSSPIINLISKILNEREVWRLVAKSPPWRMRSKGDFFKPGKLEDTLQIYRERFDCAAVLILVDMDDDCPKEKAFEIVERVREMGHLPFSVVIVCPNPEFEVWFLACLENIHPGSIFDGEPEDRRDAKGYLRKEFNYKPTHDQLSYTRRIDIQTAEQRSRSFRRLIHAIEELIEAKERNETIITPNLREIV